MVGQSYKTHDSRGGQPLLNQHPQGKSQKNRQQNSLKQSALAIGRVPIVAWIVGGVLLVAVIVYWTASGTAAMTFSQWLEVLIVPITLAATAYLFNWSLKTREQNIAQQRAQDEALQSYLDPPQRLQEDH